MKIKILKQVNASIGGINKKLQIGDVVDASPDEADNLKRGGYAEAYPKRPAAKVTMKPPQAKTGKRAVK